MKRRTIVIISLAVLGLLGVAGWNLYGWWLKHKLERYQAELVSHGEKLTINALVADRHVPEFNSADYFLRSTALVRNDGLVGSNPPPAMRMVAPGRAMVGWQRPVLIEGYGWDTPKHPLTNTWTEFAGDLERSRKGIALLHEITAHPDLDFHLDYNAGANLMLPHLAPLKKSAQALSAAALVDLHKGDTTAAAQHIRAMLALAKGARDEPLLISQLVRIAILQITIPATWELLQSPGVSEADLKQIQADFVEQDFIGSMKHAFEMERAMGSSTIRHYREQGGIYDMYSMPGGGTAKSTNFSDLLEDHAKKTFSPKELRKTSNELLWQTALSYEDELKHLQGMSVLIEGLHEAATNRPMAEVCSNAFMRISPGANTQSEDLLPFFNGNEDVSLAAIRQMFCGTGASLLACLKKIQSVEVNRALVTTAIALRRYHDAHGNYPPELAALAPEYLAAPPRDPVDGKPLRYRLQPAGGFLLYSIGVNGVDDGGDASPAENISGARFSLMKGRDWVWPQPATAEDFRVWEEKQLPSK